MRMLSALAGVLVLSACSGSNAFDEAQRDYCEAYDKALSAIEAKDADRYLKAMQDMAGALHVADEEAAGSDDQDDYNRLSAANRALPSWDGTNKGRWPEAPLSDVTAEGECS